MLKNKVLLITSSWLFAASVFAGPFGLEMGMSLKEIGGKPEKIGPGKYKITVVPKPHSAFQFYVVQVAPVGGLCYIKAMGNQIETSVYGSELKSDFSEMEGKLEKSYGEHKTVDSLREGSIWHEPNEFMMSMLKKERKLMAFWFADAGSIFSDNILKVTLSASAVLQDRGILSIDYLFSNVESCDVELAAKEDDAL